MADKSKFIGRMRNQTAIRLESQDKVQDYRYELETILDLIGHPEALITDRSFTAHFFIDDENEEMNELLQRIGDHFGIQTPQRNEFLVDIAKRARKATKGR